MYVVEDEDKELTMARYLLNVMQPVGGPLPDDEMAVVMRDVSEVDRQLRDAGVWVFSGGLHQPEASTVVRVRDGEALTTDGPYAEGKEFIGGFTVVDVPDLDVALDWAGKLAAATTLPIEVRPFQ
ncbi:YciI family protein [Plantactinospora sp. GCM10030261]|uniref:YciI family protein n=1 Tax=Plantactinospora sp. GCM10030261 TaxID=3273420 RepID=UPI0036190CF6